ncbi:MAG: hypothetical protein QF530_13430 [SAR202 cluster bacterium]|nr:hypothetical protein [SAR202 cluster bacterium]
MSFPIQGSIAHTLRVHARSIVNGIGFIKQPIYRDPPYDLVPFYETSVSCASKHIRFIVRLGCPAVFGTAVQDVLLWSIRTSVAPFFIARDSDRRLLLLYYLISAM